MMINEDRTMVDALPGGSAIASLVNTFFLSEQVGGYTDQKLKLLSILCHLQIL